MNFFSIDFSTANCSLFIKTKNKTFIKLLQSDKFTNDLLMKEILNFFIENNLEINDVAMIFVNQGPGNFSSLRASIATAKGISLAKNLKLFGYNTFLWSCTKYFNKKSSIFSFIKFRKRYFVKKFDKNLKSLSTVREVNENEILEKYDGKFKVIPKNAIKHFNEKILKLNNLDVVNLDYNELEFLQLKGLLDKDLIRPLYLS